MDRTLWMFVLLYYPARWLGSTGFKCHLVQRCPNYHSSLRTLLSRSCDKLTGRLLRRLFGWSRYWGSLRACLRNRSLFLGRLNPKEVTPSDQNSCGDHQCQEETFLLHLSLSCLYLLVRPIIQRGRSHPGWKGGSAVISEAQATNRAGRRAEL